MSSRVKLPNVCFLICRTKKLFELLVEPVERDFANEKAFNTDQLSFQNIFSNMLFDIEIRFFGTAIQKILPFFPM